MHLSPDRFDNRPISPKAESLQQQFYCIYSTVWWSTEAGGSAQMSADDDNNWQELLTGMKSRDDCFEFTCCFILSASLCFSFVLLFSTLALWPICVHVCRRRVHSVFERVSSFCRSFSPSRSLRRYTFTRRPRRVHINRAQESGREKRRTFGCTEIWLAFIRSLMAATAATAETARVSQAPLICVSISACARTTNG